MRRLLNHYSCLLLVSSAVACSGNESSGAAADGGPASGGSPTTATGGGSAGGARTTGGSNNGGGGVSNAGAGGTSSTTGGASNTTGGASNATGGASNATGGSTSAGGTGGGAADPAEITRVSGYLTNRSSGLPNYAYDNIQKNFATTAEFDTLVHAIVMSCTEFAPSEPNWLVYCEAVITSAIVSESSYDPQSNVLDGYGTRDVNGTTANDPTVGLLQIRLSSTVQDYNGYGPLDKMAAIGCSWPASLAGQTDQVFWATNGGTTYLSFMQDVSCNIGLATWYYFSNATGNGGASPVYTFDYCAGNGIAGNMVIGLLSHLMGPGFPRPPDQNNSYVTGIKGRFATLLGGLPSPDPFAGVLAPEPTKYCR